MYFSYRVNDAEVQSHSMKATTMTAPQFYTDVITAQAGQTVNIHASCAQTPGTLKVSRVARKTAVVAEFKDIPLALHLTPNQAGSNGCDWPIAFSFDIPETWKTGYYDLELIGPDGTSTHHYVVVRKSQASKKAKAVMVLATNTYQAYNYWGGANSYARTENLAFGAPTTEADRDAAIGELALHRPYSQGLLVPPPDVPRLVNLHNRKPGEPPMPEDMSWFIKHQPNPYDYSACYINKWEHVFAAWCEENDYDIDYLSDHDFERGEDVLADYATVLLVGHSEYWSGAQRDQIDRYVDNGGNLAVFSGNTAYWKVRWENENSRMICHKWKGETNDPLWSNKATRGDATHLMSHPEFGQPEAEVIGLSFLYGGYHRLGMCAARGSGGYTIYNDQHWVLEGADLFYGDVVGSEIPFIGYENDGCPIQFGEDGLPKAGNGVGVPDNLEIIALAPTTLFESDKSPFPALIPPENPDVLAQVAYGETSTNNKDRLERGHAVMASFKKGNGEVFNGGTTEWAHGLGAKNPYIEKMTHNVFERFGLTKG